MVLQVSETSRYSQPYSPSESTLVITASCSSDELPEFPRSVLESLRQPLEDGVVAVARVGGHALFPARFQLVGTPIVY